MTECPASLVQIISQLKTAMTNHQEENPHGTQKDLLTELLRTICTV